MPHPADQAMPHIFQLSFLASGPVSHSSSTSAHSHMDMMQPENQNAKVTTTSDLLYVQEEGARSETERIIFVFRKQRFSKYPLL